MLFGLAVGSKFKIHENVQLFADLGYTVSTKTTSSSITNYGDGVAVSVNSKADLKFASANVGVSYLF